MRMTADTSCLLVVDIQERLLPTMADPGAVVDHTLILLQAAAHLAVPVLASEQYPRGLGPTVAPLREVIDPANVVEKMHFSCFADDQFQQRLQALGRRQTIVTGIESHVCVLQTADDLQAAGYDVFVVADAVSSRKEASYDVAMTRLRQAGVNVVTTEMVIFEWLHRSGTDVFRQVSRLIR